MIKMYLINDIVQNVLLFTEVHTDLPIVEMTVYQHRNLLIIVITSVD